MKLKRHIEFLRESNDNPFEVGKQIKDIEFVPTTAKEILKLVDEENDIVKKDKFIQKFENNFSKLYLIKGMGEEVLHKLSQGERYLKDTYGEYYDATGHKLNDLLKYMIDDPFQEDDTRWGYSMTSAHSGYVTYSFKSFDGVGHMIRLDPHTGKTFFICDEEFKNELEKFIAPLKTIDKYDL